MDTQEVKKAKKLILTTFLMVVVIVCVVIGAAFVFSFLLRSRPLSPNLTRESVASAMGANSFQVLVGEDCYLLENSQPLNSFCDFSQWTEGKPASVGARVLTVELAEEYELAFYEGGAAQAYDGYSSTRYQSTVWYTVPDTEATDLAAYIQANGSIQEMRLGPSSWFTLVE